MPRSASNNTETEPVEDSADIAVAADENGEVVSAINDGEAAPEKTKRTYTKKPLPEGMTDDMLGYGDELEPVNDLPAKPASKRGRSADPRIGQIIEQLKANPGTWFKIGLFRSPVGPSGIWKDSGVEFYHSDYNEENDSGAKVYVRYARMPEQPTE